MKSLIFVYLLLSSFVHAESRVKLLMSTQSTAEFTNALIDEDSPYLQQHAHNPVNWYPWNKKSLLKARIEHKPIFLSIGYSTCHWCHVMAHESFEGEAIARLINKNFIAIKVDREELPHLDKYYQNIHILLKHRSGGWPLTAILTEEAKPFFIGTYIPPSDNYNLEGLDTLLPRLAGEYKHNKEQVFLQARRIEKMMQDIDETDLKPVKIELSVKDEIYKGLKKQFDEVYYGFSRRPKFPESSKISLLFDLDALGLKEASQMALHILRAMALHGLYDQVEGGFFRYSVDAAWEIPHFEKMLYTNAELIPLYVKAYELTGDKLYEQVVRETIDMIEERFQKRNVYFSASDADTKHQEGGYFIYSYEEMISSMKDLNTQQRNNLIEVLDLNDEGNFEEYTHINFYDEKRPLEFQKMRGYLQDIRQDREYPFIDKKINTAWNSMMIEALFSASRIDDKYQVMAEERLQSLLMKMYKQGVLYHQAFDEKEPVQKALLEDYAFLISALLQGYQENFDAQYLFLAKTLADEVIKKFYDGKFWYLSRDGLKVHADMLDKYYTAPMNKTLMGLLKLASLSGERKYFSVVQKSLERKSALLNNDPSSFASAMQVLLREKRSFVTLKADKQALFKARKKLLYLSYPFVLLKAENKVNAYLACDMGQCFSIDKDLDSVIAEIEKR